MFDTLSDKLGSAIKSLSGRGRISEANVREAMDEVRSALVEADVNLEVLDEFCEQVLADAMGQKVTSSLKPGQQMIGIVNEHLVELMGPSKAELVFVDPGPTIIMMCGLQGTGKTTTCGKLAAWLKQRGKKTLVAACDLQRPAAVEQLRVVIDGVREHAKGNAQVDFYGEPEKCAEYGQAVGVAVEVALHALRKARDDRYDVLVLDTAGRLHVDDDLMSELQGVQRSLNPHQVLLVVDAMAGQDAVYSAREFHERLSIDGVILTKLDSDTRGGAALSVKHVTGAPIIFIGVGEKQDQLEEFHPDRMAGRILGMGDVVSLVEKAQEEVDEAEAEALAEKMMKGEFSMNDFIKQIRSIRRMGSMKSLLGLLPGVGKAIRNMDVDESQLDRLESMVGSMTETERENAGMINKSRVRRISRGSGTSNTDVNKLLKQFGMMKKMTSQMAGMGMLGKMKAMKNAGSDPESAMAGMGMPDMNALAGMGRGGKSTKTASVKKKFKPRKKRK
jgi:signal recognition particle subunit SRP54